MKRTTIIILLLLAVYNYGYSQSIRSVKLKKAGTLAEVISDEDKATITELTIVGKLNSDDVKILRRMAGATDKENGYKWEGQLKKLDLSKASFVNDKTPYSKVRLDKNYSVRWNVSKDLNVFNVRTGQERQVDRDEFIDRLKNSQDPKVRLKAEDLLESGKREFKLYELSEKEWQKLVQRKFNIFPDSYIIREDGDSVSYYMINHTAKNFISSGLFYKCKNLESIILCDDAKHINRYALSKCSNLIEITIPKNTEKISSAAFHGSKAIRKVRISKNSKYKIFLLPDDMIKSRHFKNLSNDCQIERY